MLIHSPTKQASIYYSHMRELTKSRFFYMYFKSFLLPIKNTITLVRIGSISAGLLHDMMSPVTALVCSLNLIDDSDPNAKIILDTKVQTEKTIQFIREQLNGDIDSKNFFSISETIVKILKILQHKATNNRVKVSHISHGTIDEIYLNRLLFSRIIMNVISNAIDSYETSNTSNREVFIETFTKEKSLEILVRDFGCGMSKKELKNVFKYFYTSKENGIGIGLPTVKRIVKKHLHGSITCTSEINIGTMMKITIPLP